ncbi:MAG: homocysteine S-methyltransferase family protein [Elusimicrobia bacterium]|nr:homocysteine S-methyltransferase family protein [Elusimicrobiota bacterium]
MAGRLEDLIKEKILIFDGAMATYLAGLEIPDSDFGGPPAGGEGLAEHLCISRPDIIEKIHSDYLDAGADVIETNTFGANRITLSEYGLENKVAQLNAAAVKIAVRCARKYSAPSRPRFAAGAMGPTTKSLFVTGGISFDEMREAYFEQACALVDGGVDLLIFETCHDIMNLKAGLAACLGAFESCGKKIPVMASVSMDSKNFMLSGHDAGSAYAGIEHFPLFAFGFNCSTGPSDMALRLETLSKISKFPVFAMPNAGIPDENGEYNETPESFSEVMKDYAKRGFLNIAGGCCGTNPEHIKLLAKKLGNMKPGNVKRKSRWVVSGLETLFYDEITPLPEHSAFSAIQELPVCNGRSGSGVNPPLLIGERNNSIGSKKFREIVSAGKWDDAVELAKTQVKQGAHLLDVCLSNPERNELEDARILIPKLARAIKAPLMIDTTDIKVMELALKNLPGKSILNSVNFEFGEDNAGWVAKLALTYGAKAVFGVIDENKEQGLPVTSERKAAVAERGYEFFTQKCGLPAEDIIFDALVFPVGVGKEYAGSAVETLKALQIIKNKFPLSKTLLGISNVSFGLPHAGRDVLNSVFLHHAAKAGLDMAIVNVEKLVRYSSIPAHELKLAEDILFNREENAANAFAEYFRSKSSATPTPRVGTSTRGVEGVEPEDRLRTLILEGSKQRMEEVVNGLLKKMPALEIINGPVLEAMAEVGKLFGRGDLIVTEVLQSAEAVRKAADLLEPFFKSKRASKRGKILLATVKGDVHDIGKNIVSIIFESNGFEVIDIGVKTPPEAIVENALKEKPDFIGLSGLLTRSIDEMAVAAGKLRKAGISAPLLLGGAALTEKAVFARIKPEYKGPVFYSPDAMAGLNMALKYKAEARGQRSEVRGQKTEAENKKNKFPLTLSSKQVVLRPSAPNSRYYPDEIPEPPDFKRHVLRNFNIREILKNLNQDLFNMRFLKLKKTNLKKVVGVKTTMEQFKKEIISGRVIKANAAYRFFPANSEGNRVKIFNSRSGKVIEYIDFLRQKKEEMLSIADFIMPLSSGKRDCIAFFIVACGEGIREFSKTEREKGNYLKSYVIEALALSLAEAFAETIHGLIRKEWGIEFKQGKRYSFGYPSCPELSNQAKIFKILEPEKDVGVKLTDNFMMEPEASVSGFVLHNPKAKYLAT